MQLKDYVQDLIDNKKITVGAQASPNAGLQIYQNAFLSHNGIYNTHWPCTKKILDCFSHSIVLVGNK